MVQSRNQHMEAILVTSNISVFNLLFYSIFLQSRIEPKILIPS
jgi:hypothetical protein